MRRWILRSFCLTLLLLCIAGWMASYTFSTSISYVTNGQHLSADANYGTLYLYKLLPSGFDPKGLDYQITYGADEGYREDVQMIPHCLGFSIGWEMIGGTPVLKQRLVGVVGVPFWFLTILATALGLWVWRRTAKPKPLSAFPVEAAGNKERG